MASFSSSKTSNVATGPKISCWMIGVEVLDFDQAGPVESAEGQRPIADRSAADNDLAVAGRVLTIRSTRATAAKSIRGPICVFGSSPGPTTTCGSRILQVLKLLISDAALNEDARARHAVLASKGRNTDGQYWEWRRAARCRTRSSESRRRAPGSSASASAPAAAICRPTSILPVKPTMSTSADWMRNGAPALPDSVNMLTTPAGSGGRPDAIGNQRIGERGLPR